MLRNLTRDGAAGPLGALLVSFIATVAIFPLLGFVQVFEVSEAREGVVVDEILSSGELILPLRNGEIVPSKPVFFHWFSALGAKLHGGNDEYALRLVPAVSAVGTILVTYAAGLVLGGFWHAVVAALILLSTADFYQMAQDGRVDMFFIFFTTAAILTWLCAARPRPDVIAPPIGGTTYLIVAIFCGLAVFAKGPLGLILPLMVIGTICFAERGLAGCRNLLRPEWLIAIFFPLPWYVAAILKGGDRFTTRVLFENVNRFVGAEGITAKGPFFYLREFWEVTAPWSLFVAAYILLIAIPWRKPLAQLRHEQLELIRDRAGSYGFALRAGWLWFMVGVIFFSFSVGKRKAYLLPLLPGLALSISFILNQLWERYLARRVSRVVSTATLQRFWNITLISWTIILAGGVLIYLASLLVAYFVPSPEAPALLALCAMSRAVARDPWGIIIITFMFVAASLAALRYSITSGLVGGCIVSLYFLLLYFLVVPVSIGYGVKGITHTYKYFAKQVAEQVPASETIRFVKTVRDESFDGFFFYFKRHVQMIDPNDKADEPGIYLARQRWIAMQTDDFRRRMSIMISGGRLTDQSDEKLLLFRLS